MHHLKFIILQSLEKIVLFATHLQLDAITCHMQLNLLCVQLNLNFKWFLVTFATSCLFILWNGWLLNFDFISPNFITLVDLQQRLQKRIGMNLSSRRHGNLYISKEVLCVHEVPTRVGDNINKQRFYLVICFTLISSTPWWVRRRPRQWWSWTSNTIVCKIVP